MLLLILLYFSDKQAEDQPKNPAATANVDLIPLETPQRVVEKSVEGSTAIAQGILSCHSSLIVSIFCTRVLLLSCQVLFPDYVLLTESG